MSTTPKQTINIPNASDELIQHFASEASRLNLSPAAYLWYLLSRQQPGLDQDRLDRMVDEVFGRYGQTMRKLAQ